MLVFISDLHITDRRTGVQHLDLGAFAEALPNIARQARENGAREVTFVFLGDIFDLVRTDFWTNLESGKPWNLLPGADKDSPAPQPDVDSAIADNMLRMLHAVVEQPDNRPIFELWSQPLVGRRFLRHEDGSNELLPAGDMSGRGREIWPCDVEPKRIYIPGNHDRFTNQFAALRRLVIEKLGLHGTWNRASEERARVIKEMSETPFPNHFFDQRYRVFARHGHEWDEYNFEHTHVWQEDVALIEPWRYLDIPIGELLAAEASGRMPQEMDRQLVGKVPDEQRAAIVEQTKTNDDVRPVTAILPWMLASLARQPEFAGVRSEALEATIEAHRQVAVHFDTLPFLNAWAARHETISPFDYVDRLQIGIAALRHLSGRTVRHLVEMFTQDAATGAEALVKALPCLKGGGEASNYEEQARQDLQRVRADASCLYKDTLFILYGHTHWAAQVPLESSNGPCSVYLNTGTWRPLVRQTWSGDGFMRWKNLTYTLFYCAEVDTQSNAATRDKLPMFETWTGSLLG